MEGEGETLEGETTQTRRRSKSTSTEPDSDGLYDEPPVTAGNLEPNTHGDEVNVKVQDRVEIDIQSSRPDKQNRKASYLIALLMILMIAGFAVMAWKYFELKKASDKQQQENKSLKQEKETWKRDKESWEREKEKLKRDKESWEREKKKLQRDEALNNSEMSTTKNLLAKAEDELAREKKNGIESVNKVSDMQQQIDGLKTREGKLKEELTDEKKKRITQNWHLLTDASNEFTINRTDYDIDFSILLTTEERNADRVLTISTLEGNGNNLTLEHKFDEQSSHSYKVRKDLSDQRTMTHVSKNFNTSISTVLKYESAGQTFCLMIDGIPDSKTCIEGGDFSHFRFDINTKLTTIEFGEAYFD